MRGCDATAVCGWRTDMCAVARTSRPGTSVRAWAEVSKTAQVACWAVRGYCEAQRPHACEGFLSRLCCFLPRARGGTRRRGRIRDGVPPFLTTAATSVVLLVVVLLVVVLLVVVLLVVVLLVVVQLAVVLLVVVLRKSVPELTQHHRLSRQRSELESVNSA